MIYNWFILCMVLYVFVMSYSVVIGHSTHVTWGVTCDIIWKHWCLMHSIGALGQTHKGLIYIKHNVLYLTETYMQCLHRIKGNLSQQPLGFVVLEIYTYSQGPQQSLQLCKYGSKMLEICFLPWYCIFQYINLPCYAISLWWQMTGYKQLYSHPCL